MISGGARGVGIVTFERIHSTLDGVRKANSFFLNPRSLFAQCCFADDRPCDLLSSPLPKDTVQSASHLKYALQRQYLSLKTEGGVQEWRPVGLFVSRDFPVSRRWPFSDIAEAAQSEEPVGAQGEQIGTLGSVEDNAIGTGELSSEEVQFSRGFKLDLVEGIKDMARQAEIWKEEVTSLDYTVSPTPYTPVDGAEAVKFVAICVLLVFVFWLGNYYVPDLIFKDTVFREEPDDPLDPTSTTSGDKNLPVSNEEPQEGSKEASKTSKTYKGGVSSSMKSGTGFSQIRKQNRPKSAKKK